MQPSMVALGILLLLGAAAPAAGRRQAGKTHQAEGIRQATGSPVEKVVQLLTDLKGKVEQDGENEQQVHGKYVCFCDKAMKAKADAIDKARASLRSLGQEILKLRGTVATRTAEIKELTEAIATNEDMQAEKTVIRQKENVAFMTETAEMKQALLALEKAIILLRNASAPASAGTAFVQSGMALHAATAISLVLEALPAKVALAPEQLSQLSAFTKAGAQYAPQSETIQGILRDMYDTFSADLEHSTGSEADGNRKFESFIALKVKELKELQSDKQEKEAQKAEAEEQLAEASALYDGTEKQRKADIEYFDVTKAGCEAKYAEWTERSRLRTEELKGIGEALEILTSDSARELFAKAIKAGKETHVDETYDAGVKLTSFLQLDNEGSTSTSMKRAYALVKAQATGAHSIRLAHLAARIHEAKVGHFEEVIKAIDNMMVALKKEDAADIAKRDQCKEEYKNIASTSADLTWKIENNEAKISKLVSLIEQREAEKVQTIEDIKTITSQMEAMTSERTTENQEFLQKKQDDQNAIKLLDLARAALGKYYAKNKIGMGPIQGSVKGLALQQQKEPDFEVSEWQAPDAMFSDKGVHKHESKDILSIMTMLIEDLTDEIKNGMKDEETAQLQYEAAMKAAQKLEADLREKKQSLIEAIAQHMEEKGEEQKTKNFNTQELNGQVEYKAKITPDCDWILGAFAKRAERRAAELSGLSGAKDYLAGASEAALLQEGDQKGASPFDDQALSKISFLRLSS